MNSKTYSLSQVRDMMSANEIPMVFMQTKAMLLEGKYTWPLGSYALSNWKLCHIETIGFNGNKAIEELVIVDIQQHFRKYV